MGLIRLQDDAESIDVFIKKNVFRVTRTIFYSTISVCQITEGCRRIRIFIIDLLNITGRPRVS